MEDAYTPALEKYGGCQLHCPFFKKKSLRDEVHRIRSQYAPVIIQSMFNLHCRFGLGTSFSFCHKASRIHVALLRRISSEFW